MTSRPISNIHSIPCMETSKRLAPRCEFTFGSSAPAWSWLFVYCSRFINVTAGTSKPNFFFFFFFFDEGKPLPLRSRDVYVKRDSHIKATRKRIDMLLDMGDRTCTCFRSICFSHSTCYFVPFREEPFVFKIHFFFFHVCFLFRRPRARDRRRDRHGAFAFSLHREWHQTDGKVTLPINRSKWSMISSDEFLFYFPFRIRTAMEVETSTVVAADDLPGGKTRVKHVRNYSQ